MRSGGEGDDGGIDDPQVDVVSADSKQDGPRDENGTENDIDGYCSRNLRHASQPDAARRARARKLGAAQARRTAPGAELAAGRERRPALAA